MPQDPGSGPTPEEIRRRVAERLRLPQSQTEAPGLSRPTPPSIDPAKIKERVVKRVQARIANKTVAPRDATANPPRPAAPSTLPAVQATVTPDRQPGTRPIRHELEPVQATPPAPRVPPTAPRRPGGLQDAYTREMAEGAGGTWEPRPRPTSPAPTTGRYLPSDSLPPLNPGGDDYEDTESDAEYQAWFNDQVDSGRWEGFTPQQRPTGAGGEWGPTAPKTTGEKFSHAANRFMQTATGDVPAGMLEQVAVLAKELDLFDEYRGQETEELATYRAGEAIRKWAERTFPTDPDLRGRFLADVLPAAAGSMVGFMGTAIAGRALRMSSAATAAAAGAGVEGASQFRDAREHGATDQTARRAGIAQMPAGASEALPIERILGFGRAGARGLRQIGRDVAEGMATEALQEGVQNTSGNLIAKLAYDPSRPITEGLGTSMAAGAIVGGGAAGISSTIGHVRGRNQEEQPAETSPAPDPIARAAELTPAKVREKAVANRGIGELRRVQAEKLSPGAPDWVRTQEFMPRPEAIRELGWDRITSIDAALQAIRASIASSQAIEASGTPRMGAKRREEIERMAGEQMNLAKLQVEEFRNQYGDEPTEWLIWKLQDEQDGGAERRRQEREAAGAEWSQRIDNAEDVDELERLGQELDQDPRLQHPDDRVGATGLRGRIDIRRRQLENSPDLRDLAARREREKADQELFGRVRDGLPSELDKPNKREGWLVGGYAGAKNEDLDEAWEKWLHEKTWKWPNEKRRATEQRKLTEGYRGFFNQGHAYGRSLVEGAEPGSPAPARAESGSAARGGSADPAELRRRDREAPTSTADRANDAQRILDSLQEGDEFHLDGFTYRYEADRGELRVTDPNGDDDGRILLATDSDAALDLAVRGRFRRWRDRDQRALPGVRPEKKEVAGGRGFRRIGAARRSPTSTSSEPVPHDGWRTNLIKARAYANELAEAAGGRAFLEGVDWTDLGSIVKAIDTHLRWSAPEQSAEVTEEDVGELLEQGKKADRPDPSDRGAVQDFGTDEEVQEAHDEAASLFSTGPARGDFKYGAGLARMGKILPASGITEAVRQGFNWQMFRGANPGLKDSYAGKRQQRDEKRDGDRRENMRRRRGYSDGSTGADSYRDGWNAAMDGAPKADRDAADSSAWQKGYDDALFDEDAAIAGEKGTSSPLPGLIEATGRAMRGFGDDRVPDDGNAQHAYTMRKLLIDRARRWVQANAEDVQEIKPGMVAVTSYSTGPYLVTKVQPGHITALNLADTRPKLEDNYLNNYRYEDGRWLGQTNSAGVPDEMWVVTPEEDLDFPKSRDRAELKDQLQRVEHGVPSIRKHLQRHRADKLGISDEEIIELFQAMTKRKVKYFRNLKGMELIKELRKILRLPRAFAAPMVERTTPGTQLKWKGVAGWIAAWHQLGARKSSSKKYTQQDAHVESLTKTVIDAEQDLHVLRAALALFKGRGRASQTILPPKGKREGSHAVQVIDWLQARIDQLEGGEKRRRKISGPRIRRIGAGPSTVRPKHRTSTVDSGYDTEPTEAEDARADSGDGDGLPGGSEPRDESAPDAGRPGSAGRPPRGESGGRGGSRSEGPGEGTGDVPGSRPKRDGDRGARPRSGGRGAPGGARRPGSTAVKPTDYRIPDPKALGRGGEIGKAQGNLDAIRTLKTIEAEDRYATPDEQAILARYVGWGGLINAFPDQRGNLKPRWEEIGAELRALLTDEEYAAAKASTPNAHFTAGPIVQEIWKVLTEHIGVGPGARILEPGVGIGYFLGLAPEKIAKTSHFTAVDLDVISAKITGLLYPQQTVLNMGFQDLEERDGSYDLAISNVPFEDTAITSDPRYAKHRLNLHDFYFIKSLDLVRPGGLVAFITSKGTLDKKNGSVRELLADRADFLGAVRLPEDAFKANAGTTVTTDIVFLRKKLEPEFDEDGNPVEPYAGWGFRELKELPNGITVNEYFARNPHMMLGEMVERRNRYGPGTEVALQRRPDENTETMLGPALWLLPSKMYEHVERTQTEMEWESAPEAPEATKEGGLYVDGDTLRVKIRGRGIVSSSHKPVVDRVGKMIELRDLVRSLLDAELADVADAQIERQRKALKKAYDAFVKRYGAISRETRSETKAGKISVRRPNRFNFKEDPEAPLVFALDKWDPETERAVPSALLSKRQVFPVEPVETAASTMDAVPHVLAQQGKVDVAAIARMTGQGQDEVELELERTAIAFRNPAKEGAWETADEYLAGNVRRKLELAKGAAAEDSAFKRNVEALEAAQPEPAPWAKVRPRLGAAWVPADLVQQFVRELLGSSGAKVSYFDREASWKVELPMKERRSNENVSEWGTERAPAAGIIEQSLNQGFPTVKEFDPQLDKYVVDADATFAARGKQELIKARFEAWAREDVDRAEELQDTYNRLLNNTVQRQFRAPYPKDAEGRYLPLPGASSSITLTEHQMAGVWRIVQTGNTGLFHVVGAGKTYTMVAAAMETKRLGLARKSIITVPNHMLSQFSREFLELYPAAKILVATKDDFTKERRKEFTARAATEDWDAIVMTHSSFGRVGMSPEYQAAYLEEEIKAYEKILEEAKTERNENLIKQVQKALKRRKEKLRRLLNSRSKDKMLSFEEMGVDQIFVDEAHLFKNLDTPTKLPNISIRSSQRALDLFLKTRWLQEQRGEQRGVVLATGTPVSNSIVETYVMQRYLQPKVLEAAGIFHFDAWAGTFGENVTALEMAPSGKGFRANTRFARFVNVPSLVQMFRQTADVVTHETVKLPVPKVKGEKSRIVSVPGSEDLRKFTEVLAKRAEAIKTGKVDPRVDNMLKITSEAAKAALDMRLINPRLELDPTGKIMAVVSEVHGIWKASAKRQATQMVFLDMGTPKTRAAKKKKGRAEAELEREMEEVSWTVYGTIREKLIEKGIPEKEIAFIHDASSDVAKLQLFDDLNSGRVRIILGSTEKMGAGTNAQKKLLALHHVDVPWRPADLEQRNGRIVRRGNENPEIELINYVTEGSFDSYRWGTVLRKEKAIQQIMAGSPDWEVEDVDGSALNANEAMALASGNPKVLEHAEKKMEVGRLRAEYSAHVEDQLKLRRQAKHLPTLIEEAKAAIAGHEADIAARKETRGDGFTIQLGRKTYEKRADAADRLLFLAADIHERATKLKEDLVEKVGTFAGFDLYLMGSRFGARVQLRGRESYGKEVNVGEGASPLGLMAIVENIARHRPEDDLARTSERLRQHEKDLENATRRLGESFTKGTELAKAEKELEALEAELQLEQADNVVADDMEEDEDSDEDEDDGDDDEDYGLRPEANPLASDHLRDAIAPDPEGTGTLSGDRGKIVEEFERVFGRRFRVGKVRMRKALGTYNSRSEIIRTRIALDIETIAHELGHHLHRVFYGLGPRGNLIDKPLKPWGDELRKLDANGDPKQALIEGHAEFIRRYITNPDAAKEAAPRYYEHFDGRLKRELPEAHEILLWAREEYAAYVAATPEGRFDAHISTVADLKSFTVKGAWNAFRQGHFRAWLEEAGRAARTANIDRYHPLLVAEQEITGSKEGVQGAWDSPYKRARLLTGTAAIAEEFLEHGTRYYHGRTVRGPSLKAIMEGVNGTRGELREFRRYAVARRAEELMERGIETGLRKTDVEKILERYGDREHFVEAFEQLQTYNRHLLEYLRDAGVLSSDTLEQILELNQSYVPFNRAIAGLIDGRGGGRLSHVHSPIKRIRGSGRKIIDPFESIIRNTYHYVRVAERNAVSETLAKLADEQGAGPYLEKLPAPVRKVKIGPDELLQNAMRVLRNDEAALEAMGDLFDALPADDPKWAELLAVWRPGDYFRKENHISVLRGKKRVWYEVSPEIYQALEGMNRERAEVMMRWLYQPAAWLRAGATITLEFVFRNLARDQLTAGLNSEAGYKPFRTFAKGFFHYLKQDELYHEWRAAGGDSSALVDMDRETLREGLDDLVREKGTLQVVNPLWYLQELSRAVEHGTRLGEYELVRNQTGDKLQAAFASREVSIDFSMKGERWQGLRLTTAFWSAQINGWDKTIRTFRRDPKRFHKWAFTAITLPSMIFWFLGLDDEELQDVPAWQKALFWVFRDPITGTILRFPKPPVVGQVYGSAVERLLDWVFLRDSEGMRRLASEFLKGEIAGFIPIPTALTPIIENAFNYDTFLRRPVVARGLEGIAPEYQSTDYTSEVAKLVGKATGASPQKIDNIIQDWTGGTGRYITGAISQAGRLVTGETRASRGIANWPGVRGFTVPKPGFSSESVERFYERLAEVRQARATINHLRRAGNAEAFTRWTQEHEEELVLYGPMEAVAERLATLRARAKAIQDNASLSATQKQQQIENLGELARRQATAVLDVEPAGAP
jgi:N12 class adenine-specific DNA methylase